MSSKNLISEMPVANRPRERLIHYGEGALSDQELLAIILRTGFKEKNVMHLSLQFLNHFGSLYELKVASLEELQEIKGVGLVKAVEIKAVIELGMRLAKANQVKLGRVTSSMEIGQMMIEELKDLRQEHLMALYLNTKNEMIKKETLFIGSLNQSIAHPREIFRSAVKYSAARIILVHNHPSGDTYPSKNDIEFTKRVVECGELMGIELLDHLIIGHQSYCSLKELHVI
ncbi:DNA repair protein RadC [uncultured Vagococcus sp.]|uniref:RadC family protein n=1 Tax=uncultured Vagococcus sp. TaxID=189676 RepID=UPI0028D0E1CC|nr:DNA repair protein RadC [uncultured Vagococcus sp.]